MPSRNAPKTKLTANLGNSMQTNGNKNSDFIYSNDFANTLANGAGAGGAGTNQYTSYTVDNEGVVN